MQVRQPVLINGMCLWAVLTSLLHTNLLRTIGLKRQINLCQ